MKIETYLSAMEEARYQVGFLFIQEDADNNWLITKVKRNRQFHAFRSRILRMYAEKDELEELRAEQWREIMRQAKRIAELEAEFNHYQDQYHE